ncbi:MAG: Ig-like domain-containing protein, partial [Thermodesulfobacteriota bacterium]|nr:Ig-like domain-containing protein [Thermodesulfobacteriota bacterium]
MRRPVSLFVLFIISVVLSGCIFSAIPSEDLVTMYPGETQRFQVLVYPSSDVIEWYLDKELIEDATAMIFEYSPTTGDIGNHELKVVDSMGTGLEYTHTWSINVVEAKLISIEITPSNPGIPLGYTQQFTATGIYSDSTTQDMTTLVTWSSSNTGVATISNASGGKGLASSVSTGFATITATDSGTGINGTTGLTVTDALLKSVEVTPINQEIPAGYTQKFIATGIYSDNTTRDITTSVTWISSDTSVATIRSAPGRTGLATGVGMGTATISAIDINTSIKGTADLTVTAALLESIEVTPTNPEVPLGNTRQFTATGVYSDSSTQDMTTLVTWSSSAPLVATISNASGSEGFVASVGLGSTTITAIEPGTGMSGTTNMMVIEVALVSIEVTPSNPKIPLGLSQQFTATGIYNNSTTQDITALVTWSSSALSVATIGNAGGSQGLAASIDLGSTTITATDSGTGISGTTSLTVTPAALISIAVTPTNSEIPLGYNQQFTATGIYSDSTTKDITTSVTWSSSDTDAAAISNASGSKGLATSIGIGLTTITAIDPDTGITGTTGLIVTEAVLELIAVTPTNPEVPLGYNQQFTATGTYSDSTIQDITTSVTWSSSDTLVATISNASGSEGYVTSVSMGSITITATDSDTGISGTTDLTVTEAVLELIAVTPINPEIPLGYTQQFAATGIYSDNTTQDITTSVTWNSSDAGVALISNASGSEGYAGSVGIGSATITAIDPGTGMSGATDLTVTPEVLESIAVTPTNPVIPIGNTQQFTATGAYSNNTTLDITTLVTWSSANTSVAVVSNVSGSEGLASGVDIGSTTITAIDPNTGISGTTGLTVTIAVLESIEVTPANLEIPLGHTQQFTATGTYSDSTIQDITTLVTWSSSAPSVATISNAIGSQGYATSVAMGSTTIIAIDPNTGISGLTGLTVTAEVLESIAVTPTNPVIPLGYNQQFTAIGVYSDNTTQDITTSVTWSSSSSGVATISNASGSQGYATSVSMGLAIITATDSGTEISGITNLTVTAAMLESIAVTPANPEIPLGNAQQFTATGTYSDSTTQDITTSITWSSSASGVATISNASGSQGYASSIGIGSTIVTATDSETGVSGTTVLMVTAAVLESIAVMPTNPEIPLGYNQQFTATGIYSDNTTQDITTSVTWSSSSSGVATISNAIGSKGLATSVGTGSTIITAIDSGTGISSATNLAITAAVLESIEVTPTNPEIPLGYNQQFTATGTY